MRYRIARALKVRRRKTAGSVVGMTEPKNGDEGGGHDQAGAAKSEEDAFAAPEVATSRAPPPTQEDVEQGLLPRQTFSPMTTNYPLQQSETHLPILGSSPYSTSTHSSSHYPPSRHTAFTVPDQRRSYYTDEPESLSPGGGRSMSPVTSASGHFFGGRGASPTEPTSPYDSIQKHLSGVWDDDAVAGMVNAQSREQQPQPLHFNHPSTGNQKRENIELEWDLSKRDRNSRSSMMMMNPPPVLGSSTSSRSSSLGRREATDANPS